MAGSGNPRRIVFVIVDVLSSHEKGNYLTSSLDDKCRKFVLHLDRNFSVDLRQCYLGLKLKFVKGRGYETYISKEVEKEHKEETKFGEEAEEEEESPVFRVTFVNNLSHSLFPTVEVNIKNQQIKNSRFSKRTNLTNRTTSTKPPLDTGEFCTARCTAMRTFLLNFWKHLCLIRFLQGDWNCSVDPMAFFCMVYWGLTSSPILNFFIQIWKLSYV